ncbi:bone morphogenetic protein 2-like [Physella acuta]|uniref:bone morphogenetic protein 2-like n=1 Tax=Physella acuta TaxID=109671 RepID=UPI0027DDCC59|nr:bone morphogenetic protein 2-like [Physella acuta]
MLIIRPLRTFLESSSSQRGLTSMTGTCSSKSLVLVLLVILTSTSSSTSPSTTSSPTSSTSSPSTHPPPVSPEVVTARESRPDNGSPPGMQATPTSHSLQARPPADAAGRRSSLLANVSESDRKKLNALELMFLNNVGLKARPKVNPGLPVSDYMLDLYKTHSDGVANNYLSVKGNGLVSANTVRSFEHTDSESRSCLPPLCSRIHFDVASISEDETIAGAELRIFAHTTDLFASESAPAVDGALAPTNGKSLSTHRLQVHEIMQPETPEHDGITRLIDTRPVNLRNASWVSFDIQPAVLRWRRGVNHGLEVRVVSRDPVVSTDNHIRLRRAVHLADHQWALERPLLVVYTDDKLSPSSTTTTSAKKKTTTVLRRSRSRRNAETGKKKKDRKNKKNRKKKRPKIKGNKSICKRHGLYVDFGEVGWNDWIVAPHGYPAYYCKGECNAPLPDFSKASNHAMLQARVYMIDKGKVPMVCCVPVKMKPISMLYRDENGRTVLKTYQDMTVDECGCK